MKKNIIVLLLVVSFVALTACNNEKGNVTQDTQDTQNKNDINQQVIEKETLYDFENNENLKFCFYEPDIWDRKSDYGEITCDSNTLKQFHGTPTDEKILPISVSEQGEKTTIELYEEFIKPLNVKTQFEGLSEAKIYETLNKLQSTVTSGNSKPIFIYVTSQELYDIRYGACPEDMKIHLTWYPPTLYEDEMMDFYDMFYEKDEDAEGETAYNYLKDSTIIWYDESLLADVTGTIPDYGEVTITDMAHCILNGMTPRAGLLAISVAEYGEKTTLELYEEYIKPLNVKTQFEGLSEERIKEILNNLDSEIAMEEGGRINNSRSIYIFVTEHKFRKMIEDGCSEDMKIQLSWCREKEYRLCIRDYK